MPAGHKPDRLLLGTCLSVISWDLLLYNSLLVSLVLLWCEVSFSGVPQPSHCWVRCRTRPVYGMILTNHQRPPPAEQDPRLMRFEHQAWPNGFRGQENRRRSNVLWIKARPKIAPDQGVEVNTAPAAPLHPTQALLRPIGAVCSG